MLLLALGVLLWSFTHFLPTRFTRLRALLIGKMGEKPYKGLCALVIAGSIALMVFGWKSAVPEPLYYLGEWAKKAAGILVLLGFIFFGASQAPNNLRRLVRNPQLTGVCLWAIGHLLANGDSRSLVLFGGMLAWAITQIVFSNQRDGAWTRPEAVAKSSDVKMVVISIVIYAVVVMMHTWLFNVRPY